jgi:ankyrin repeat protein
MPRRSDPQDPSTILPSELSEATGWNDETGLDSDGRPVGLWGKLVRLFDGAPAEAHEQGRRLRAAVRAQDVPLVARMISAGVGVNAAQEASLACIACRRGNLPLLEVLLDAGVDPNRPDRRSQTSRARTPLQEAARRGWVEGVGLLLKRGAHPDDCEQGDFTPLHLAARAGHVGLVRTLLSMRADACGDRHAPAGPLHETASVEILEMLLAAGALPNQRDRNKSTPLHQQAYHGRPDLIARLLAAGADPLAVDRRGRLPIFLVGGRGDGVRSYRRLREAIESNPEAAATSSSVDQFFASLSHATGLAAQVPAWMRRRDSNNNTLAHSIAARATSLHILEQVFEDAPALWGLRNGTAQTPVDILASRDLSDWAGVMSGKVDRARVVVAPALVSAS